MSFIFLILLIVLTLAINSWWRGHFRYYYFGGVNSIFNSYLSTLVGSFFVALIISTIIISILPWVLGIGAVIGAVWYFTKDKKTEEISEDADGKEDLVDPRVVDEDADGKEDLVDSRVVDEDDAYNEAIIEGTVEYDPEHDAKYLRDDTKVNSSKK